MFVAPEVGTQVLVNIKSLVFSILTHMACTDCTHLWFQAKKAIQVKWMMLCFL